MSKKLLLADDSITIQKVIGIIFANEDYELTIVDNGDDALVKACAARPDLILADVHMPGKDGYELTAAVRQDAGLASIPVLLLSGAFEAFDEGRAEEVGADGWIAKPFESQALIDRVDELLARAPIAPPAVEAAAPPEVAAVPESEAAPAVVTPEFVVDTASADASEEGLEAGEDIWGDVSFGEEDLGEEPLAAPETPLAAAEEEFVFEEEPLAAPETPPAMAEEDFVFGEDEEVYDLDEADILEEVELEPVGEEPAAEVFAREEAETSLEEPTAAFQQPAAEDFSFVEEGPEWGVAEEPQVEEPLPSTAAPVAPAPEAVEVQVRGLSEEELEAVVEKVAGAVVERLAGTVLEKIAWEVVPDLAESLIKEELRKIKEEAG